jgi:transcriptional regulator with XRE-family HTH domain
MQEQSLGSTIASLRKEKGMTQAELAAKMNVTDKAVSKWERDLACPDVKSIPRLAENLGISVEELMHAKGKNSEEKGKAGQIIGLVLKAVPLAMGVAVTVLSILGELDVASACTMLGIGMACMGVALFQNQ